MIGNHQFNENWVTTKSNDSKVQYKTWCQLLQTTKSSHKYKIYVKMTWRNKQKFHSNLLCLRWLVRYCSVKLNLLHSWLNRIFPKGLAGGTHLLVKWPPFLSSVQHALECTWSSTRLQPVVKPARDIKLNTINPVIHCIGLIFHILKCNILVVN